MILQPIVALPVLLAIAGVLTAFAVWRLVVSRGRVRLAWVGRIVMILLILAIALRPVIPATESGPTASGGLEVYFVVDTTSSSSAEDWGDGQPRLDGMRDDIAAIAADLSGAQFSLVTFDAATVQRVPLTTDSSAIASAASVLEPEVSYYSRGSGIDQAVEFMTQLLGDAAKESPDQQRVLYYLGDGEQTLPTPPGSFETIAPFIDGGAVLGYGTDQGARMLVFDGYPDDDIDPLYIQDYTASPPADAISRIDEAALGTIASELGVNYIHRSASDSVARASAGLDVGDLTVSEGEPGSPTELYWVLAIPLALLALAEAAGMVGAVLEVRPKRRRAGG
jgi:Ca-activated chloride channel homolog